MATKSFLKTIRLKGRHEIQAFIRALEHSEQSGQNAQREEDKPVHDMDQETIRSIFANEVKQ